MVPETLRVHLITKIRVLLLDARCKICDSCNVSVVQRISVDRLISDWKGQFGIEISQIMSKVNRLQLFECNECHLKFFLPNSYQGAITIYEALEKFDWYYMPLKWEHSMALRDLKPSDKILEVGCGEGHFLQRVRADKDIHTIGIDLNQSAIEKAKHKGLPVHCMDIQEATSLWAGQFDAVCSFQVLEHLQNPRDFLLQALSLIRPGGKLLLGVPNADSFLKHQFNVLDMPPHHRTRWDAKAISSLPKIFPLSECRIRKEPLAEYHVGEFLDVYLGLVAKNRIMRWHFPQKIKAVFTLLLIRSKVNKLLRGHTLYVSFTRN